MPSISIIVPCFNEQGTIEKLLEAIYKQTHPLPDMEVIIADGMSTDDTRTVISVFSRSHPDLKLKVVDNPKGIIPAGLNIAIQNASGNYIIRLDGHSIPAPDYVDLCVKDLDSGLGENVGGVWDIQPGAGTWIGRSIAQAASIPLGVGDAFYRHGRSSSKVDTVPFGAFRKELISKIGYFDETLLTNEDYEFNTRLRRSGGSVWLDPSIHSAYYARPTLSALSRQYFRYGYWKWRMLKRYPGSVRWRQALPPLFIASLLGMGLMGFFLPLFRLLLLIELGIYCLVLGFTGILAAIRKKSTSLAIGIPLAIATMHFSWGTGFLWSMIKGIFTKNLPETK